MKAHVVMKNEEVCVYGAFGVKEVLKENGFRFDRRKRAWCQPIDDEVRCARAIRALRSLRGRAGFTAFVWEADYGTFVALLWLTSVHLMLFRVKMFARERGLRELERRVDERMKDVGAKANGLLALRLGVKVPVF